MSEPDELQKTGAQKNDGAAQVGSDCVNGAQETPGSTTSNNNGPSAMSGTLGATQKPGSRKRQAAVKANSAAKIIQEAVVSSGPFAQDKVLPSTTIVDQPGLEAEPLRGCHESETHITSDLINENSEKEPLISAPHQDDSKTQLNVKRRVGRPRAKHGPDGTTEKVTKPKTPKANTRLTRATSRINQDTAATPCAAIENATTSFVNSAVPNAPSIATTEAPVSENATANSIDSVVPNAPSVATTEVPVSEQQHIQVSAPSAHIQNATANSTDSVVPNAPSVATTETPVPENATASSIDNVVSNAPTDAITTVGSSIASLHVAGHFPGQDNMIVDHPIPNYGAHNDTSSGIMQFPEATIDQFSGDLQLYLLQHPSVNTSVNYGATPSVSENYPVTHQYDWTFDPASREDLYTFGDHEPIMHGHSVIGLAPSIAYESAHHIVYPQMASNPSAQFTCHPHPTLQDEPDFIRAQREDMNRQVMKITTTLDTIRSLEDQIRNVEMRYGAHEISYPEMAQATKQLSSRQDEAQRDLRAAKDVHRTAEMQYEESCLRHQISSTKSDIVEMRALLESSRMASVVERLAVDLAASENHLEMLRGRLPPNFCEDFEETVGIAKRKASLDPPDDASARPTKKHSAGSSTTAKNTSKAPTTKSKSRPDNAKNTSKAPTTKPKSQPDKGKQKTAEELSDEALGIFYDENGRVAEKTLKHFGGELSRYVEQNKKAASERGHESRSLPMLHPRVVEVLEKEGRAQIRDYLATGDINKLSKYIRKWILQFPRFLAEASYLTRDLAIACHTSAKHNSRCPYHGFLMTAKIVDTDGSIKYRAMGVAPYDSDVSDEAGHLADDEDEDDPLKPREHGTKHRSPEKHLWCGCRINTILVAFFLRKTVHLRTSSARDPVFRESLQQDYFHPRYQSYLASCFKKYTGLTANDIYIGSYRHPLINYPKSFMQYRMVLKLSARLERQGFPIGNPSSGLKHHSTNTDLSVLDSLTPNSSILNHSPNSLSPEFSAFSSAPVDAEHPSTSGQPKEKETPLQPLIMKTKRWERGQPRAVHWIATAGEKSPKLPLIYPDSDWSEPPSDLDDMISPAAIRDPSPTDSFDGEYRVFGPTST